jgi:hypothetical protein
MKRKLPFFTLPIAISICSCQPPTTPEKVEYTVVLSTDAKHILTGENYSAEFLLTRPIPDNAEVVFDLNPGQETEIVALNNRITYSAKYETSGSQEITGQLNFTEADGRDVSLPFRQTLDVDHHEVNIVATQLYANRENKFRIDIPGLPQHVLRVETSNGKVVVDLGIHTIIPDRAGACVLTISKPYLDSFKEVAQKHFEVINLD